VRKETPMEKRYLELIGIAASIGTECEG